MSRAEKQRRARRRARLQAAGWPSAVAAIAGLIIATVLASGSGSGTAQTSTVRPAPSFALTSTSGKAVSLASYRGRDVVLYFNEGVVRRLLLPDAGIREPRCRAHPGRITVVPIVMNPAGKGMHAGLPGHSFAFIDTRGTERWYGEYPSVYLSTAGLIAEVKAHLSR